MIYYTAGCYLTEPDPDPARDAWWVCACDGETGGVLEAEHGPMTRRQARAMADNLNRSRARAGAPQEATRWVI